MMSGMNFGGGSSRLVEQSIFNRMKLSQLAHAHGNAFHQNALGGAAGLVLGVQVSRQFREFADLR